MPMSDFKADLNKSNQYTDRFPDYYRKMFKDIAYIYFWRDMDVQSQGIDRSIVLKTGQLFTIEEKVRFTRPEYMLIETLSVKKTNKVGWIYTCEADFMAILFPELNRLHMYPVKQMQKVWNIYGPGWLARPGQRLVQHNGAYQSECVAVRFMEFNQAMYDHMTYQLAKG